MTTNADRPSMSAISMTGKVVAASFVREGQKRMCEQCSEDQGDPHGNYCCDCCAEGDGEPGTYLTVRLDTNPPIGMGRVIITYAEREDTK